MFVCDLVGLVSCRCSCLTAGISGHGGTLEVGVLILVISFYRVGDWPFLAFLGGGLV